MAYLYLFVYMQTPIPIILGTNLRYKRSGSKRRLVEVEDTMMYIPFLEYLKVLLQNETVISDVNHIIL